MENPICLPMVNLTPTMKCNLKCKLCGVLVPQYEYRPHMTTDEFSRMLKAVFAIIDHVGKVQITGGEPLLHQELPEMIEQCFQYSEQFDQLWLFTNCSVPIKPQLVEQLVRFKNKLLIHASDYGLRPDIAGELINTLDSNGLEYRYLKYYGDNQYADGWVDQGDFVLHSRLKPELETVFSTCPHVKRGGSWYIRNGQMHWCGRSIRGTEVRKIPLREEDYLDIFAGTIAERREKLQKLMNVKTIQACDYCNGYYGTEDTEKRHPAGEQV